MSRQQIGAQLAEHAPAAYRQLAQATAHAQKMCQPGANSIIGRWQQPRQNAIIGTGPANSYNSKTLNVGKLKWAAFASTCMSCLCLLLAECALSLNSLLVCINNKERGYVQWLMSIVHCPLCVVVKKKGLGLLELNNNTHTHTHTHGHLSTNYCYTHMHICTCSSKDIMHNAGRV
jgi:hypothetical protein